MAGTNWSERKVATLQNGDALRAMQNYGASKPLRKMLGGTTVSRATVDTHDLSEERCQTRMALT
jgi:hypothetical protein